MHAGDAGIRPYPEAAAEAVVGLAGDVARGVGGGAQAIGLVEGEGEAIAGADVALGVVVDGAGRERGDIGEAVGDRVVAAGDGIAAERAHPDVVERVVGVGAVAPHAGGVGGDEAVDAVVIHRARTRGRADAVSDAGDVAVGTRFVNVRVRAHREQREYGSDKPEEVGDGIVVVAMSGAFAMANTSTRAALRPITAGEARRMAIYDLLC